jgi:hypothetical protein
MKQQAVGRTSDKTLNSRTKTEQQAEGLKRREEQTHGAHK